MMAATKSKTVHLSPELVEELESAQKLVELQEL
jgi:hypothetical protein